MPFRFNVPFIVAYLVVIIAGDLALAQPRPLPGVKAEGQAKENKGKQTSPVQPDAVLTGEEERPPAATLRARVPRQPSPVVPVINEFRQPTEQETAAAALGRIGRAAVPSLIQTLRHRDPEIRRQAALV